VSELDAVDLDDLLRDLAPAVLSALLRRHGRFDECEDAVQEALLAASRQWPAEGRPDNPRAWLIAVANRRLVDQVRSESARRRREDAMAAAVPGHERVAPPADAATPVAPHDDTLTLLFLCCHPELSPSSQIALTLRAVGGLTTAEIARAFLVPEATMAQRISRAKQRIKETGTRFAPPPEAERADRLRAVLHVLYLIFNEGYTASAGQRLHRGELTHEAIRLTRTVHRLLPDDGEVAGLLALMLLTEARRPARIGPDGSLVPLDEQDRSRWNRDLIGEGVTLVSDALTRTRLGPYQLQAAIAAVHDEAPSVTETDWPQVLGLYDLLVRMSPNPMVSLNRAVAVAMVNGPAAGLELLAELEADERLARQHRVHAVRGHLHELAGDTAAAVASYREAARLASNVPERRYLYGKAASLTPPDSGEL
jgi:RNA polymerase sigma factor (sigma-70 family)